MRIILDGSVSTVKRLRVLLGTLVAIEAAGDAEIPPESAIERAFAAIAEVERLMHPRAEGSDLARLNSAPLNVPVKVHPRVGTLLHLARRIHAVTDGVFDPCVPTRPGRLSDIDVSDDGTEVVCYAPVALDFGGFAKGYAVDCAIEALMAAGCAAGLVNAGGDLRVFGRRSEQLFLRGPAGAREPAGEQSAGISGAPVVHGNGGDLIALELTNAALAVSDTNTPARPTEHQGYYVGGGRTQHLAQTPCTYAAVIADKAVIADALTKCVLLCPTPVVERTLREFSARRAHPRRANQ